MHQTLIDRLIKIRERAGFKSARQLSLKMDRQPDYISKLDRGVTQLSIEDLKIILEFCNSSLEELFYEDFDNYQAHKELIKHYNDASKDGYETFLKFVLSSQDKNKRGMG